jgi:hypothetical protein
MSELTTPWTFETDGISYSVSLLGPLQIDVMFLDSPHRELTPDLKTAEYLTELHNLVLEHGGLEEVKQQLKVVKRLQDLTELSQSLGEEIESLRKYTVQPPEDYKA